MLNNSIILPYQIKNGKKIVINAKPTTTDSINNSATTDTSSGLSSHI